MSRREKLEYHRQLNMRRAYQREAAARQLDVTCDARLEPVRRPSERTRRNRERAHFMNPGYVLFLVAALVCSGVVIIGYLNLQARVTASLNTISILETELNSLTLSNNEAYSRIENSVNLDRIKEIAMKDLGMHYAGEGQVITYSTEGADYVRQIARLSD